ncbi:MAG TPA: hypothetical protein DF296_15320 [Candidatus Margulisbacteria bacterium]|nr:MAG: hypothetical protein A2X09_15135 [Bacteroidetes bacterium GWF2_43_11]HCT86560.1 hypothetical protein [Candidatus Margulisiibacteriota bacterium]
MKDLIKGKKIVVTGGSGFIGKALVTEILKYDPKVVRVFSRDDSKQFEMRHELNDDPRLRWLIGDVRESDRLAAAFEDIDIVFHTAALKHVPSCEYNPFEAVKTNVVGVQNVIEAAIANNVERVISISTDKATSPSNVMGATKLLGEKLIATASHRRPDRCTRFASVRFGNVLGSRGSVVPLFRSQIEKGGPITITDPKMQRFVITKEQAIKLVIKAAQTMHGGEVFLLKMPVIKVDNLADAMISIFGNNKNITKTYIGLRHGETLDEDLLTTEESQRALETDEMFIILPAITYTTIDYSYNNTFPVTPGLRYSSASYEPLSCEEVKKMVEQVY